MTKKRKYEEIIDSIPPGLERAILRTLSFHQGKGNAIGRMEMVEAAARMGMRVHERQLRECIKQLRRQGHLIGSLAGEAGGYYLIATQKEYQEFKRTEFLAKIADMSETLSAMDRAAQAQFGNAIQGTLF